MLDSFMGDKRLDLNAPLLSVRRHSAPLPPPPYSSSSSSAATATAEQRTRRSSLPLYKPDAKSGPVRNARGIPFVWEQSPGRPKDGSDPGASTDPDKPADGLLVASKPPPGRIARRVPDEKDGPIRTDASNSARDGVLPRGPRRISSTSAYAVPTSTAAATASPLDRSFSTSSGSSRNGSMVNLKPLTEKKPILEEQSCSSDGEDEEEDAFSDALDTLSRAESSFMNCSISGLSAGVDLREPSGRFSTDPGVRDFMMGRFLPAAQAMAASPSPFAPRKPAVPSREPARRVIGNAGDSRRQAVPLPYQHRPNDALNYAAVHHKASMGSSDNGEDDDDEDDDEYGGPSHLSVKGCGLLPRFCLKSSFCLLNPFPGMKVRGRMSMPAARRVGPRGRTTHHESIGNAEHEHTWEEVYRHKLGRVHQTLREEASKLTSESNQLSYWSDSQTADGSSSYRRSTGGGFSPCRNDMPRSPLHEGKGFVRVPNRRTRGSEDDGAFVLYDKSGEKYWEIMPHLGSKQTSGSQSPVIEKTVYVDSVEVLDDPGLKSTSSDTKGAIDKDSKTVGESQKSEESPTLEACEDVVAQYKFTEVDAAESCLMGKVKDLLLDDPHHLEAEDQGKNDVKSLQALLPPPLPKSPSESWLWHTLPSVASKNSAPLSFLGVQFCPKKQVVRASSTDTKRETIVKNAGVPKVQMRFADVLARPAKED